MEQVSYLGQTLTKWRVGPSTFLAYPELGARLMNWNLTFGDGSIRDVLYWPETSSLEGFAKVRGGNPILFPFCARSYDDGELHMWRDPDGVRRPMGMHGFARQGSFKIVRLDERGFGAVLQPDEEARQSYPFEYEFSVSYRFGPLSLACELVLANHDSRPIPWCAGHHFYFTVPWTEGHARADYAIRIPATRTLRQSPTGELIPGPKLRLEESLANPELVDTFHLGLKNHAVVFGPANAPGEVTLHLGVDPIPPASHTVVTWAAKADSPFYCVEPWMGPANAPAHQLGLQWVAPGQSQRFVVDVAVK